MAARLFTVFLIVALQAALNPAWAGQGAVYIISRAPQLSILAMART